MTFSSPRLVCLTLGTLGLVSSLLLPAHAMEEHPAVKRPVDFPPSADLTYRVKAKQSGMSIYGTGLLKWQVNGKTYRINVDTQAPFVGTILSTSSEGRIDSFGLAPATFVEKKFRKSAITTSFNHDKKTITFSASDASYPLLGGEQDRTSIIWQLISHARGASKKFVNGSSWQYFVAGPRDAAPWTFKVGQTEKIRTPMGRVQAIRVTRLLPPGSEDQQLDIWLAPSLDWYPVKIHFTENDGDSFEQLLEQVDKL